MCALILVFVVAVSRDHTCLHTEGDHALSSGAGHPKSRAAGLTVGMWNSAGMEPKHHAGKVMPLSCL